MKSDLLRGIGCLVLAIGTTALAAGDLEQRQLQAEACIEQVQNQLAQSWSLPAPPHETPSVVGDFNGDGVRDTACIGIGGGEGPWQLFVHFAQTGGAGEIISLANFSPDVPVEDMRIYREPPDEYTTRCGHMPEDCAPDALLKLAMPHDGIFLAVRGESGFLIYWDAHTEQFKREWLII